MKKRIYFGLLIILFAVTSCITANMLINKQSLVADGKLRSSGESWTMAIIPDTQTYVKFERNHEDYLTMMRWLREKKDELNLQMVLQVGDLVEQNDWPEPDGSSGDQTGKQQWETVLKGAEELLDIVPFIVCGGNHDIGSTNAEHRASFLNDYINPDASPFLAPVDNGGLLVEMWDDPTNGKTLLNAFYRWTSPDGRKFHILSLEFAPRKAAVEWGDAMLDGVDDDSVGIFLTHSYLSSDLLDNVPLSPENYAVKSDATPGKALWKNFVQDGDKVDFIFCGHVADNEGIDGQVGFRQDLNADGDVVSQMMFNAQRNGGWHGTGGDGWLRLLEFLPDGKSVIVRTYSPVLEKDPSRGESFRTSPIDYFSIKIGK
ncbi:MAG: metallophosphoesterase [Spirochaetales bacterium]|nr:metallophosphoesterase [Spirochaetales bacterium]